jgi:hypothetical protein
MCACIYIYIYAYMDLRHLAAFMGAQGDGTNARVHASVMSMLMLACIMVFTPKHNFFCNQLDYVDADVHDYAQNEKAEMKKALSKEVDKVP